MAAVYRLQENRHQSRSLRSALWFVLLFQVHHSALPARRPWPMQHWAQHALVSPPAPAPCPGDPAPAPCPLAAVVAALKHFRAAAPTPTREASPAAWSLSEGTSGDHQRTFSASLLGASSSVPPGASPGSPWSRGACRAGDRLVCSRTFSGSVRCLETLAVHERRWARTTDSRLRPARPPRRRQREVPVTVLYTALEEIT